MCEWLQTHLCCFRTSAPIIKLNPSSQQSALNRLQYDIQQVLIYQYQHNCIDPTLVHHFEQACTAYGLTVGQPDCSPLLCPHAPNLNPITHLDPSMPAFTL
jgi:hypothetical protein